MNTLKNILKELGAVHGTAYTLSYVECGQLRPHYPTDPSGPCVRLNGDDVLEIQYAELENGCYNGQRGPWVAI